LDIKELSSASDSITIVKSFELSKSCSLLLASNDSEKENEGRRIIINVLDNWNKIPKATYDVWISLIESAGFYPYLELERERKGLDCNSTSAKIRKEFHKSEFTGKYLHEVQKEHSDILMEGDKNLIVSAPTSFGKSLLIEEVVASKKYKNIVVIQPTLALLDETRKKLSKYKNDYKIIVKTSQEPSLTKGNLFLLTAERVTEYPNFPSIDFFVIDEFYKLSPSMDKERFDVLNNAFNLIVTKHAAKFYLLGPNIDKIPTGFEDKFNARFEKTSYALVDVREVDKTSKEFGDRGPKHAKKVIALYKLLLELKDKQTIIYCSSPESVRGLARGFYYFLEKEVKSNGLTVKKQELPIIQWIKENLGETWSLTKCLNYGIGIHDAALQKHITTSIIQYFNDNKLNFLFCTSTIIEGVNTSAKNVIYFGHSKGLRTPINYFDYSNIKGRAGRMMVHYTGEVYNFNTPPEKTDIEIDIPIYDQKALSEEILINIPEGEVKNKESEQYKNLMSIPQEERELFRKNGVSIEGQKIVLELLKKNIHKEYNNLNWTGKPEFKQLEYVFTLAWNLLKKGESKGGVKDAFALTTVTNKYIYFGNIMGVVKNSYIHYLNERAAGAKGYKDMTDEEIFDEVVRKTFWIQRHWFYYKVPKWLNVISNLQEFVCKKNGLTPGNYTYLSNLIENEFVRKNLSILVEYGVPQSAILKLKDLIANDLGEDQVLEEIKNRHLLQKANLILYEKLKKWRTSKRFF
jgi:hypothetical protein